jgi:hypothetical protein
MFRLLFATLEPKILPNTVVILAAKKGDRLLFRTRDEKVACPLFYRSGVFPSTCLSLYRES